MTTPDHCDKGAVIDMIVEDNKVTHTKLDKLIDLTSAIAVQGERVAALEGKSEDHESRIRKLEPLRNIYVVVRWGAGIGASLATAYLIYLAGSPHP